MIVHTRRNILICLLIFAGELCVLLLTLSYIHSSLLESLRERVRLGAVNHAQRIEQEITYAESITNILSYCIVNSDGSTDFFEYTAKRLYSTNNQLQSVQLAPDGVVTDIYPSEGNEAGKIDLMNDPERGPIVRYSRDHKVITIQGPFELKQGGVGLAIRKPVYLKDGSFWGLSIVIVNFPKLMSSSITLMRQQNYNYSLSKTDPLDEDNYRVIISEGEMDDPETVTFEEGKCTWVLAIEPEEGWKAGGSYRVLVAAGIAIVVLLDILCYVILVYNDRQKYFRRMSNMDFLTGLTNRQGFEKILERQAEREAGKPCVGILIDIDNFKSVNDTYGHGAGDAALKAFGEKLGKAFDRSGYTARYGGDEFAVLLTDVTMEQAGKEIREFMGEPVAYRTAGKEMSFTVSAGIAEYPKDTEKLDSLYSLADLALYAGKMSGKHSCVVYQPGMQSKTDSKNDQRIMQSSD